MRLCPIEDLKEGMIVARPVYDDRLDFLLSAGQRVNQTITNKAISLINVYPIGALVVVKFGNNHILMGTKGVVRRVASENLERPEIVLLWDSNGQRISPMIIDLDTTHDIQIELV